MSVLKEKAQVILLPTKDKTNINLFKNNISISPVILSNKFGETEVSKSQHLYIISDEEIKEGDWCIDIIGASLGAKPKLRIATKDFAKDSLNTNDAKKIIATTDSSLIITEHYERGELLPPVDIDVSLPQPSQGFIEKYIKEYNKGNIITDILVEYEHLYAGAIFDNEGFYDKQYEKILKISKDNTITILKNICECCGREL